MYNGNLYHSDELMHFGIKGMKWGVRRYQNKDGTLTAEGKRKYGVKSVDEWKSTKKKMRSRKSELNTKASKKYDLVKYETEKKMEEAYNEKNKQLYKNMFGSDIWYARSTTYKNAYDKQVEKAEKYVDSRMKKEFGRSYEQWQDDRNTAYLIGVGTAAVGAAGALGYSLYQIATY